MSGYGMKERVLSLNHMICLFSEALICIGGVSD